MMNTYKSPHVEVIELGAKDVITTSALNVVEMLSLEQIFHWNNAGEAPARTILE